MTAKRLRKISQSYHPGMQFASQYGVVRFDEWCRMECARVNSTSRRRWETRAGKRGVLAIWEVV